MMSKVSTHKDKCCHDEAIYDRGYQTWVPIVLEIFQILKLCLIELAMLSIKCMMFSPLGALNAYLRQKGHSGSDSSLWNLVGNQGDRWKQAKVNIHPIASFQVGTTLWEEQWVTNAELW